jgi:hemolysin activation/secretion protein
MTNTKQNYRIFNLKCGSIILSTVFFVAVNTQKTLALNNDSEKNNTDLIAQSSDLNSPRQKSKQTTCSNPPTSSATIPQTSQPSPERLMVRKIKVVNSTVFTEADFNPVIQPFEERDLTLEETRQIADAITQLYLNKGYINSRAIALSQQVSPDGVLEIYVIQGGLSEIIVQGTRRLNPAYICDRIKLGTNVPLNTNKLEEQLRLLRLDPLFANIEASLRPTGQVGQSSLIVRVEEADAFKTNIGIDNYSPASVGSERLGIALSHRNLTGMGDELAASYYRSFTGGSEVFDFAYQLPLNAMDGKLQLRVVPSRSEITQPPFDDLGIRGTQNLYEVNYRQPLIRTPQEEFALSLGFTYQDGQTFLFDSQPYSFAIGADKDGVSRTSVIKFSQDYLKRDPKGAWFGRSQFNFGTGVFNATINNGSTPDGRFFSWFGQVQRVQQLNNSNQLVLQAELQLAPNSLLASQQFVIGGGQSVRGYRQNARFGDNGFRLSVENKMTLQRDQGGIPTIQVIPFVDLGTVWNQSDNPNKQPQQTFLAATGLGLLWNQAMGINGLNLRLDYGIPLVDLSDRGNNAQDSGFYFSLRYQP